MAKVVWFVVVLALMACSAEAMADWNVKAVMMEGRQAERADALHFKNVCKCQCDTRVTYLTTGRYVALTLLYSHKLKPCCLIIDLKGRV